MRKESNGHGATAIRVQGGLLPPEFLAAIASLRAPHQSGNDYGVTKSFSLKDEIARYWRVANDLYDAWASLRGSSSVDQEKLCVNKWLIPLFTTVLGWSDIAPSGTIRIGDRSFPLTHTAFGGLAPVLFAATERELETADPRFGEEGRRRSPHGLVQELLNGRDDWMWGVVSNGRKVRLVRDNPSLTRPAFVEADLELIFGEQLYADFVLLWLAFHGSRLRPVEGDIGRCILEQWRNRSQEEGQRALERLRVGVTESLRALGNGFLRNPANEALRRALAEGTLTPAAYFEELLRLVYRLLFLFTAEERNALHAPDADSRARRLYREGYGLAHLRTLALRRRRYDRHADLWRGMTVLFRALETGAPALGLPALGGLFDAGHCPCLDAADIANEHLLEAVRSLAWFRSDGALSRVNYRDMGTEELGSVYESLLELVPCIDTASAPWSFGFVGDAAETAAKGSARKLTGSYYTPAVLVNELIRSALDPVIGDTARRHADDPRAALLALRIIDPACGSGHFLLAAARRMAIEIARHETGSDTPDEPARQHALREVVRHCVYGVDRNPLAVELCRTALWIESLEPGRPLTFLDPHIRCGDSLVGVLDPKCMEGGIPDAAYDALSGDDKKICKSLKIRNANERTAHTVSLFVGTSFGGALLRVASGAKAVEALPEDDVGQIAAKRMQWRKTFEDPAYVLEKLAADLYTGAFFAPKTGETFESVPTCEDLERARNGDSVRSAVAANANGLSRTHRFFHWHLEFRDVMAKGGFDVVLGNPPWERIKLQEQEYFANRSPRIASAPNAAERTRMIRALSEPGAPESDMALARAFRDALRESEASSVFVRKGGRFPLTGTGDVNTYAVFAETFRDICAPEGRSGFIVPTGIATDNTTRAFFDAVAKGRRLASLYDFENKEAIFPGVHRSYKFCLLTLGRDVGEPTFVFFATRGEHLADDRRRFTLTPADIARINPNTRTAPVFRSRADADLTRRIYARVPVLIDEAAGKTGNPWGISFMAMFHMSNDSGLFRTAKQLAEQGAQRTGAMWTGAGGRAWVPLYEAKMVHQFDHRWATYETDGETVRDATETEKRDPGYDVLPRYWVPGDEVQSRLAAKGWTREWLMGWRDICRSTDERTVIAGVIPRVGVGNKFPLAIFSTSFRCFELACLIGNLSSLVFDFVARQKIGGTTLNFFYLKQFSVLPPDVYTADDIAFIAPRVLELVYTSGSLRPFAQDLGFTGAPFAWNPDRRAHVRAELDAYYARLYGLNRDELRYILDPADAYGPDYPSETFRVLRENEKKMFGEYRTARLVLAAWDRMEEGRSER